MLEKNDLQWFSSILVYQRMVLAQSMHWSESDLGKRVMSTLAVDKIKAKNGIDGSQENAEKRRQSLYSWLKANPPDEIGPDEIEAHFSGMPSRYWDRVTKADLLWGLKTIHKFLNLVSQPNSPATAPVLEWKHLRALHRTKVMICTWDRHGLLAKAAAAFNAVRINVLQADVFTRADNIVLDVFQVSEMEKSPVISATRLKAMLFLLGGALSESPSFASFWAASGHRLVAEESGDRASLNFDNTSSSAHTLLRIEAPDRLGLLSDLLQGLTDCNVNIDQAIIDTENGLARDLFFLSDIDGQKIVDTGRFTLMRKRLLEAIIT
jgi:[protein-PII] uridylyltransferase